MFQPIRDQDDILFFPIGPNKRKIAKGHYLIPLIFAKILSVVSEEKLKIWKVNDERGRTMHDQHRGQKENKLHTWLLGFIFTWGWKPGLGVVQVLVQVLALGFYFYMRMEAWGWGVAWELVQVLALGFYSYLGMEAWVGLSRYLPWGFIIIPEDGTGLGVGVVQELVQVLAMGFNLTWGWNPGGGGCPGACPGTCPGAVPCCPFCWGGGGNWLQRTKCMCCKALMSLIQVFQCLKCYKNEHSFEICHWAWSSKLSCKISLSYDQPFTRKWYLNWSCYFW